MNLNTARQAISDCTTAEESLVSGTITQIHPAMTLHLLGDFQLILGDTPLMVLDLPRLQSLLAYLALHSHAPQSRAHLAFLLWPDSNEFQARTNLRNLLFKMRQKLPDTNLMLDIDQHTLQWRHNMPGMLDVLDFERAIAYAELAEKQGDRSTLRMALEQAVQYYRGELLPGCYDEWIIPERDRLSQLFHDVLMRLMELLEEEGDYQVAIRIAQRLLRHDSLEESAYRSLIRLYAICDNQAAAERTYQNCITVLERELAVEPSTATREVYERYTNHNITKPASFPRLPFVRRVRNRWVKVSPERCMENRKQTLKTKRCFSPGKAKKQYALEICTLNKSRKSALTFS